MRKLLTIVVLAVIVCGALGTWTVVAQTEYTTETAEKPETLIPVSPTKIEQFPEQFKGTYVQIRDYFGERIERRHIPQSRELRSDGITPETHFAFATHRVLGSNMICFIARDNPDAQSFFDAPLVPETAIFLVGHVRGEIGTRLGRKTVFLVERVVRGHTPPPMKREEKKRSLSFTLEWKVETPQGTRVNKQEYQIPESGKRYEIPDPYQPGKILYMTFRF